MALALPDYILSDHFVKVAQGYHSSRGIKLPFNYERIKQAIQETFGNEAALVTKDFVQELSKRLKDGEYISPDSKESMEKFLFETAFPTDLWSVQAATAFNEIAQAEGRIRRGMYHVRDISPSNTRIEVYDYENKESPLVVYASEEVGADVKWVQKEKTEIDKRITLTRLSTPREFPHYLFETGQRFDWLDLCQKPVEVKV